MARQYRSHHRSSHGDVSFVAIILLTCVAWTHRSGLERLEKLAVALALIAGVTTLYVVFYKLLRGLRARREDGIYNLAAIDQMSGLEFEKFLADMLVRRGFRKVYLTEQYDLGIDIVAEKDGITWGIQVKCYSGLVGASAIRQVVTALNHYNCQRAMVVTNSEFSRPAQILAESNNCILIDRERLRNILDESASHQEDWVAV